MVDVDVLNLSEDDFPPLPRKVYPSKKLVQSYWLTLPKYVWKIIFIKLADTKRCSVFALRAVCKFLQEASSLRLGF